MIFKRVPFYQICKSWQKRLGFMFVVQFSKTSGYDRYLKSCEDYEDLVLADAKIYIGQCNSILNLMYQFKWQKIYTLRVDCMHGDKQSPRSQSGTVSGRKIMETMGCMYVNSNRVVHIFFLLQYQTVWGCGAVVTISSGFKLFVLCYIVYNSVCLSDAMLRHRTLSILVEVMACCPSAQTHYMN